MAAEQIIAVTGTIVAAPGTGVDTTMVNPTVLAETVADKHDGATAGPEPARTTGTATAPAMTAAGTVTETIRT